MSGPQAYASAIRRAKIESDPKSSCYRAAAPLSTVALGAIIIVASLGLIDIAAFRFLRQVRPAEFWLAVVIALGVLTVGLLQGILVAVMLSLINVLLRIARPHEALLDKVDASC